MSFAKWRTRRAFLARRREFYLDLATALIEGESELNYMRNREASLRKERSRLAEIYRLVAERLGRGANIADALVGTVPETEIAVLSAYQRQANLPKGLHKIAHSIAKASEINEILMGIAFTPAVSGIVVLSMLAMVHFQIAPVLRELVQDESQWLPFGRFLIHTAAGLAHWWWLIFPSLAALAVWIKGQFSRWHGPTRARYDDAPGLSLYRDYNAAQLLGAMGALLESNMPVPKACHELAKRSSPWARWHLLRIAAHLERHPTDLSGAFSFGFVGHDIGSRLGDLIRRAAGTAAIQQIGEEATNRLIPRVRTLSRYIEVALMAFVAVGVLGINGGIYMTFQAAGETMKQAIYTPVR